MQMPSFSPLALINLGTATNVEIELPVPADATTPNVRTSMGSAAYAPEKDALIWKIRSFPGGKEYMLRAEFRLPSITDEEAAPERKAPIRVKFEIPYFTVSGIQEAPTTNLFVVYLFTVVEFMPDITMLIQVHFQISDRMTTRDVNRA
ncbi:AP-1 complex subunit mu-2-like isoform X1 [Trifolium pratense]|uniref:AP-1 complex subunit mu-2-like isoform X1 n=1 Tax=Trifolium pratense TaxID=57577 RepID=UPI001E697205|nr:AP-1 complex subunit mu-2-like isoform X1 [Trifolium pratense]